MYGNNNPNPQRRQRITVEQAQAIALQTVPGRVIHVDLEFDDGVLVYEVFIMTQEGRIYEVDIHGRTGALRKIELEDDDDLDDLEDYFDFYVYD